MPTRLDLTDVFFVTEDIGFIAGEGVDSVFTSETDVLTQGSPWFNRQHEPFATNDASAYYRKTIVRTVPETPPPSFFKTRDGGASWTAITTPFVTNVTDIHFVNPSYGFVTTEEEGVYKTTDGGERWQKVLDPIVFLGGPYHMENPYNRVYFTNQDQGSAFADLTSNKGFHSYHPVMVRTNDGGESWAVISGPSDLPSLKITEIVFSSDPAVGYANGDGFGYITKNVGATWEPIWIDIPEDLIESSEGVQFGSTSYSIDGVSLWGDNSGYLLSHRHPRVIFPIQNGTVLGANPIEDTGVLALDNPDIYSPREGVFYLISGRHSIGDERAKILSTKDGGSSFTEMSGLKNVAFYDWSFVGDTGYLVGPNGLLRKYEGRR
ncbi:MAG: YCF48-related protein [Tunicatimonas sp.]